MTVFFKVHLLLFSLISLYVYETHTRLRSILQLGTLRNGYHGNRLVCGMQLDIQIRTTLEHWHKLLCCLESKTRGGEQILKPIWDSPSATAQSCSFQVKLASRICAEASNIAGSSGYTRLHLHPSMVLLKYILAVWSHEIIHLSSLSKSTSVYLDVILLL